jgi:hypothetical protein
VFAAVGVAYFVVPGAALAIAGIASNPTTDFLLRTEGAALLTAAVLAWALRGVGIRAQRIGLLGLGGYFVLGSVVDLAAFADGIVGPPSVPSALVRTAFGLLCLGTAWRSGESPGDGAPG